MKCKFQVLVFMLILTNTVVFASNLTISTFISNEDHDIAVEIICPSIANRTILYFERGHWGGM